MTNLIIVAIIGIIAFYAGKNITDGIALGAFFSVAVLAVFLVLTYILYFDFGNVDLPESFIAADDAIREAFYSNNYEYRPIDPELLAEAEHEKYSYIDDKLFFELDLDIESKEELDNEIDKVYDKVLIEVDTIQNSTVAENVSGLEKLFNSTKNMIKGIDIELTNEGKTGEVVGIDDRFIEGVEYTIKVKNVPGKIKMIYQSETMMGVWEEFESTGDFEFTKKFDSKIKLKIYQNDKLIYEKYEV